MDMRFPDGPLQVSARVRIAMMGRWFWILSARPTGELIATGGLDISSISLLKETVHSRCLFLIYFPPNLYSVKVQKAKCQVW